MNKNYSEASAVAYRKELLDQKALLAFEADRASDVTLAEHLRLLALAEKDATDSNAYLYELLKPYRTEFAEHRVAMAHIYKSLGGKLDPRMYEPTLPLTKVWPGLASLVPCAEDRDPHAGT